MADDAAGAVRRTPRLGIDNDADRWRDANGRANARIAELAAELTAVRDALHGLDSDLGDDATLGARVQELHESYLDMTRCHSEEVERTQKLQAQVTAQAQVLDIVRAQNDACVEQVDAALGHRYHTRGVHFSIPHVAEKAAAELQQLQDRIDAALALHARDDDGDCRECGVDTGENPIPWPCDTVAALQGDQPTGEGS